MKIILPIVLVAVTVLLMADRTDWSRSLYRNRRNRGGFGAARIQYDRDNSRASPFQFSDRRSAAKLGSCIRQRGTNQRQRE